MLNNLKKIEKYEFDDVMSKYVTRMDELCLLINMKYCIIDSKIHTE